MFSRVIALTGAELGANRLHKEPELKPTSLTFQKPILRLYNSNRFYYNCPYNLICAD